MSNAINPEHYNRLNPHITGNNVNPLEVREYIERELKDRLAMVL